MASYLANPVIPATMPTRSLSLRHRLRQKHMEYPMKFPMAWFEIAILLCVWPALACAADFYLAPDGDDA
jgi:hypothetical protein